MLTRIKKALVLLICWAMILIICELLIDAYAFGYIYRRLPARIHYQFDSAAHVISQYSKLGDMPKNYIAIFGDSYAEGVGDWLYTRQLERMPDTQVTHLLHESTGRDVVALAESTTGSLGAYILNPFNYMERSRSLWFYKLPDPDMILLYFYEGNDIIDNDFEFVFHLLNKGYDSSKIDDFAYFKKFIGKLLDAKSVEINRVGFERNFLFARLVALLSKEMVQQILDGAFLKQPRLRPMEVSESVKAIVGGKLISLPKAIQTAPLDRNTVEMHVALSVFENSLRFVVERYPHARIGLVFIPSPGTTYRFAPGFVDTETNKAQRYYPTSILAGASNQLCAQIRDITLRNQVSFYDTRPALRAGAMLKTIHGPTDWGHFSEPGYRILAKEIDFYYRQLNSGAGNVATPCGVLD